MGIFSVAIPLAEGEDIRSEQDVIDKLYEYKYNNHPLIYYNLAQEAVNNAKTTNVCKLLIVQLEKIKTTHKISYSDPVEKIVGLLKFDTINSDEPVGNVVFQPFSPKFRKVSVLRDYINACRYTNDNEDAKKHLDTLLTTIHPTALPFLVKILNDNEEFKCDQKLLIDSIYHIENAFIERQKTIDILWGIAAVLTVSIFYWIRKAFFPESFGYFIRQTFRYDEIENIRENMLKFWSISTLGFTCAHQGRTEPKHLEKFKDKTAFHKKLFQSQKEGFFNHYGQLRKHLIDHPETKTLEFVGTQQQIDRWLFFANAEKHGIHSMNLNNKLEAFDKIRGTTMMKPQKTLIKLDGDRKKLPIDDSNDLDKEEYNDLLGYYNSSHCDLYYEARIILDFQHQ